MLRIDRCARFLIVLLIIVAAVRSETVRAEIKGLGKDGWHTWQVSAVEAAPGMCCSSWRRGSVAKKQCDLDGRNGGFSSFDDSVESDDGVQIFTLMKAGVATKIRLFSSNCPVSAKTPVIDLGPIETGESVEWLRRQIPGGLDTRSNAIAAIAVHDGQKARDALVDIAKPDNDEEDRKDAIFWMGQLRIDETGVELKRFVFDDNSADIREHAAFSYSQSNATDVADVLIRQGRNDGDPGVRSQAWFWLAQTEAAESEAAICGALLNDTDKDVREEAVFALSQLPEHRAVKALATVLEDRQLGMDIRGQALFWLAQTESEEAFEYIDQLLSDN